MAIKTNGVTFEEVGKHHYRPIWLGEPVGVGTANQGAKPSEVPMWFDPDSGTMVGPSREMPRSLRISTGRERVNIWGF